MMSINFTGIMHDSLGYLSKVFKYVGNMLMADNKNKNDGNQSEDDERIAYENKKASTLAISGMSTIGSLTYADNSWINHSKNDIKYWNKIIEVDADGELVDWDWFANLNLLDGIGKYAGCSIEQLDALPHDDAINAINEDISIRRRVEALYIRMSRSFMFDEKRIVRSFDFPRALVYANRHLNDEIDYLMQAHCTPDEITEFENLDKEIEKERSAQWKIETKPLDDERKNKEKSTGVKKDRQLAWLPGQDINNVLGIDIETTGLKEYRDYIIDIGYERMYISPTAPVITHSNLVENNVDNVYTENYYNASGAYDAHRQMFGVSDVRQAAGNPAAFVSGIETGMLAGRSEFIVNMDAQRELLTVLKSAPFVAHNAKFEHKHFMANVTGYAEAYRDGLITIIDTMYMSIKWDKNGEKKEHGKNRLDSYAKRWDVISADNNERHLGLEDSHIMLVAMKNHLKTLHACGQGPWDEENPIEGIGGKKVHSKQENFAAAGIK